MSKGSLSKSQNTVSETTNTRVTNWRNNSKAIEKYQFIHNFVPSPDSGIRARLLSNKALLVYCLVMLFFITLLKIIPSVFPGVLGYASNINMADLLKYTNEQRVSSNLDTLRLNPELCAAAEQKAKHMFENNYWAHISPEGVEPWDFILQSNYDYIYAGENLAKNFSTSNDVVSAWMKSPTHRENLMSGNYDEVGFAVVNGVLDGYETTLVVQMFGRPRDLENIATVYEEESLLASMSYSDAAQAYEVSAEDLSANPNFLPATPTDFAAKNNSIMAGILDNKVMSYSDGKLFLDISFVAKSVSLVFGALVTVLLLVDLASSRKHRRSSGHGHAFMHLTLVLLAIVSIWFLFSPGNVA